MCVCVLCVPHHFLLLFFYYHPVPLFFFASSSSVRIINAAECEKMQRPTNNNNSSNSSSREMRKGHKLFTTVDCNTPKCVTIPVSHATDCCRVSERPEINFFPLLLLLARLHSSSTVFFFFFILSKLFFFRNMQIFMQISWFTSGALTCRLQIKCQVPPSPTTQVPRKSHYQVPPSPTFKTPSPT